MNWVLVVTTIIFVFHQGFIHLGLIVMCQKSPRQPEVCIINPDLPGEWKATLMFVLFGVLSLTLSCFLILMSFWKPSCMSPARWISFFASKSWKYNSTIKNHDGDDSMMHICFIFYQSNFWTQLIIIYKYFRVMLNDESEHFQRWYRLHVPFFKQRSEVWLTEAYI